MAYEAQNDCNGGAGAKAKTAKVAASIRRGGRHQRHQAKANRRKASLAATAVVIWHAGGMASVAVVKKPMKPSVVTV
jgi:alkylhydroperoxidase family enzyme